MDIPRTAAKSPSNLSSSPAALFLSAFSSPSSSSVSLSNSWNAYSPPPDAEGQVVSGYTLGATIGYGATSVIRLATSSSGGVVACKIVKNTPKKVSLEKRSNHLVFSVARAHSPAFCLPLHFTARTINAKRHRAQESVVNSSGAVGGLNQDDAGMMFRQVVRGLRYMHTVVRYVHRDIKLENVLVDEQGHCRITDFGMARRIASRSGYADCSSSEESGSDLSDGGDGDGEDEGIVTLTRTASLTIPRHTQVLSPHQHILNRHLSFRRNTHSAPKADTLPSRYRRRNTDVPKPLTPEGKVQPGSLPYAAPELLMPLMSSAEDVMSQADSKRVAEGVHPAQDIWALGVLLYVLLTGRFPFSDAFEPRLQMKILHGVYEVPQDVGKAAERVLRGCLERSISSRWSIDEVDEAGWGVGWGVEGDRALGGSVSEDVETDAPVVASSSRKRSVSAEEHPYIYNANVDRDVEEVSKVLRVDVSAPIERTRPCLSALHDSIYRGPPSSVSTSGHAPVSGNLSASRSAAKNLFVDVISPHSSARDDDSALVISPLPMSASMTLPSLAEVTADDESAQAHVFDAEYVDVDAEQLPTSADGDSYPRTPDQRITSPLPLSPLKGFGIPPTPALTSLSFVGVSSPPPSTSLHASSPPYTVDDVDESPFSLASNRTRRRSSQSNEEDITYQRGRSLRKTAPNVTESRSPSPSVQPKTPIDSTNDVVGALRRPANSSESPLRRSAVESLEMFRRRSVSRGHSPSYFNVRLRQPGDLIHGLHGGLGIISRSDSGSSESSGSLEETLQAPNGRSALKGKGVLRDDSRGVYDSGGSSLGGRVLSPDSEASHSLSPSPSGRSPSRFAYTSFAFGGHGFMGKDATETPSPSSEISSRGRPSGEDRSRITRRAGSTPPTTVHTHRHHYQQPSILHHPWPLAPFGVHLHSSQSSTPHSIPSRHHHNWLGGSPANSSGQHTPSVVPMKSAPAQVVTVRVPVLGTGTGVAGTRSRSLGPG
ncbi:hypothetical protein ONZ45_g3518 [Pleurotus djamor]|nr:hypothetical protein ONZ45_g3518 [Pleurotus djamor]